MCVFSESRTGSVCGRVAPSPAPCPRCAPPPTAAPEQPLGKAVRRTRPSGAWGNILLALHEVPKMGAFAEPPVTSSRPTNANHPASSLCLPPSTSPQPHVVTSESSPDSLRQEETLLTVYRQGVWNEGNDPTWLRVSTLKVQTPYSVQILELKNNSKMTFVFLSAHQCSCRLARSGARAGGWSPRDPAGRRRWRVMRVMLEQSPL